MENLGDVQSVINEYKEAANCFLYIRQVLFSSYGQDNKTWDMSESALLGVSFPFQKFTTSLKTCVMSTLS